MEEIEFYSPKREVLGWPYTSDQEFAAYPVMVKQDDQGFIVQIVLEEYVVLPASQIFFMHNRSFPGIENQEGYLIKDRRGLNNEVQIWWVPLSSGVKFDVCWASLELITLEPGRLRTGQLYRAVTTLDSKFYEVIFDNGMWSICGEMEEIRTGALIVQTGYYLDSAISYPRIFVWFNGEMRMFVMNYAVRLVPDFRGMVPNCFIQIPPD